MAGQIDTTAKRSAFLDLLQCYGATDVYLALGPSRQLLSDPNLSVTLAYLYNNGIRADALISPDQNAADPAGVIEDAIDAVDLYNDGHSAAGEKFLGIHVDYEPWIGTGSSSTWVAPLIAVYQAGAADAAAAGMPFIADINGPKLADDAIVTPSQRQQLFDAVRRLVLMHYDTTASAIEDRTDRFLEGLTIAGAHDVILAVRAEDACQIGELAAYDEVTPGVGGTAVYEHPLPPMPAQCLE